GLVADLVEAVGGILTLQLGFDLGLGLVEALRRGRLDLDDSQDVPAERAFYRLARLVERQLERHIPQLVCDLLAAQGAEVDGVRILPGDRRRDFRPILAGGERGRGFLGLFFRWREDLLDVAALGRLE